MSSQSTDLEAGNETVVEIEDTGDEGDGIAYTRDGFAIVVADAALGERARVRIERVDDDHAIAERIEGASDVAD